MDGTARRLHGREDPELDAQRASASSRNQTFIHYLLGLSVQKPPRHAKRYADIANLMTEALRNYAEEVRAGLFPTREHSSSAAIDPIVFEDRPKP